MKRLWWLLAIPIIIALFYFSTLSGSQKTETPVRQPDIASYEPIPPTVDEIYNLVNQERAKIGVAPLKLDPRLNQSAQEKAEDMAKNNYFDHVNPTTGVHGYTIISKYAKECRIGSENLANSYPTSRDLISAWLRSVSHKEAMLNPNYVLTGVGVSKSKVVQHFCTT